MLSLLAIFYSLIHLFSFCSAIVFRRHISVVVLALLLLWFLDSMVVWICVGLCFRLDHRGALWLDDCRAGPGRAEWLFPGWFVGSFFCRQFVALRFTQEVLWHICDIYKFITIWSGGTTNTNTGTHAPGTDSWCYPVHSIYPLAEKPKNERSQ